MNKLIVFLILFNITTCFSQNIINEGEVSGKWTKENSPYIVKGNISIVENKSLFIEAGVRVQFDTLCRMNIKGQLIAEGNSTDSIFFTSFSAQSKWNGLRFLYKEPNKLSKLSYCIVENSIAPEDDNSGGGVSIKTPYLIISNSTIRNNYAVAGGGVNCSASASIINTKIINNKGSDAAGILMTEYYIPSKGYSMDTKPRIIGCLIAYNTARIHAGLRVFTVVSPLLKNCTICYNTSTDIGTPAIEVGSAEFYNSILYYNVPSFYITREDYLAKFKSCNIEGGRSSIKHWYSPHGTTFLGVYENNIDTPPKFTDSEKCDFSLAASHCINRGAPNTNTSQFSLDLLGNPRVSNGRIDIGAYEHQGDIPNRCPFLIKLDTIYLFKNKISKIEISFLDDDLNDNHTVTTYTNESKVSTKVNQIADSAFNVEVTPEKNWSGKFYLFCDINDNNTPNALKSHDSIPISISNNFKGIIDSSMTFADTVEIIGDVIITKTGSLNISPGTSIEFQGFKSIYSYGVIKAIGSKDQEIKFNASDTLVETAYGESFQQGWGGITFIDVNVQDTVKFHDCIFRNTGFSGLTGIYSRHSNGTINIKKSKNFEFKNCLFDSNFTYKEKSNAGIATDSSTNVNVKKCVFTNGKTHEQEGNYITSYNSQINVDSCKFINSDHFSSYNSSCVKTVCSDINLSNSYFTNNNSYRLIECYDGKVDINNCTMVNNKANAIWMGSENAKITNNKIINNGIGIVARAKTYIVNNLIAYSKLVCKCSNSYGVAIELDVAGQSTVINNTIVHNSQDSRGNAVYFSNSSPAIKNNIFWKNSNEGVGGYNGVDGYNGSYGPPKDSIIKYNYIPETSEDNPLFSLSDTLDFQLLKDSPCINKGIIDNISELLPDLDLNGNKRIDDVTNILDLGAYEFQTPDEDDGSDDDDGSDGGDDDDDDGDGVTTSIEKIDQKICIYPNPARNDIFISETDINYEQILICDLNGKIVKSQKHFSSSIDISSIPVGVYIIILTSSKEKFISKFIKY